MIDFVFVEVDPRAAIRAGKSQWGWLPASDDVLKELTGEAPSQLSTMTPEECAVIAENIEPVTLSCVRMGVPSRGRYVISEPNLRLVAKQLLAAKGES